MLQPFWRFDLGPVAKGSNGPEMWRVPTMVSAMKLPEWYQELDPNGWEGLIELPMEQQQDLICAYQAFHQRKVYRSWASLPAVPPEIRESGGGDIGERMRWLASAEDRRDRIEEYFRSLSRDPMETDVQSLDQESLGFVVESGKYRWLVVHERGYYLAQSGEGGALYRHVVRGLTGALGVTPLELVEHESFDWAGKKRNFPEGPAWVPWASREVQLPTQQFPSHFMMAVFDLADWVPQVQLVDENVVDIGGNISQ